jgi:DNA modification methylase
LISLPYDANGVQIYLGDCREVLRQLPSESVHCCVTSPPYWGLRDYGCDGQIGLEDSPVKYIATMREVFAEVSRVLRSDGTLWLNMGDSYAANQSGSAGSHSTLEGGKKTQEEATKRPSKMALGLKPKDLVGIPWMLAFALREDGWYLRQDIIWAKPNPMPESVTDRCTKSHEYIFLLSKSERYYYNQEAIKEPVLNPQDDARRIGLATLDGKSAPDKKRNGIRQKKINKPRGWASGDDHSAIGWATQERQGSTEPRYQDDYEISGKRNRRSVWQVTTEAFPEAHFATFPQELIKPCILAGCPEGGTVLDPFMGSGTTGLVARSLHSKAIGIELNPAYIEIAAKRLSQFVLPL